MHKMTGRPDEDVKSILSNIREIACDFASQRAERQRRRELMKEDFDKLRESGYLMVAVPSEFCLLYTSPSPRDGLLGRMPC